MTQKLKATIRREANKFRCSAKPLGITEIVYGDTKEEALWEMECLLSDLYNGEFTIY